jgi:hypothetical protein
MADAPMARWPDGPMTVSNQGVFEPRNPGLPEMAPPVLLAPLLAAAGFVAFTGGWQFVELIMAGAVATAIIVGWPLLFWAYDNGHLSILSFAIVGAMTGAAPFLGALVSGAAGLYIQSTSVDYVAEVFARGASIPYYGLLSWPKFTGFAATGLATGIVWGLASRAIAFAATRPRRSRLTSDA